MDGWRDGEKEGKDGEVNGERKQYCEHITSDGSENLKPWKFVNHEWRFYFHSCSREESLPPLLSHTFSLLLAVTCQSHCC
jgi:hypothetical protein